MGNALLSPGAAVKSRANIPQLAGGGEIPAASCYAARAGAHVNKLSSILGPILVIAIAVVFIVQFQAVKPGGATKTDSLTCAVYVHDACAVPAGSFKAAYSLIASTADPGKLRSMGMGRKVA